MSKARGTDGARVIRVIESKALRDQEPKKIPTELLYSIGVLKER